MIDEEFAEWRRLCDAATSGPWTYELDIFNTEEGIVATIADEKISMLAKLDTDLVVRAATPGEWTAEDAARLDSAWAMAKNGQELRDAAFIAAARTAVPMLLAELERLRARVVELEKHVLDNENPASV